MPQVYIGTQLKYLIGYTLLKEPQNKYYITYTAIMCYLIQFSFYFLHSLILIQLIADIDTDLKITLIIIQYNILYDVLQNNLLLKSL